MQIIRIFLIIKRCILCLQLHKKIVLMRYKKQKKSLLSLTEIQNMEHMNLKIKLKFQS